jgi:peptide methionine sulfoxide reductase msrA/msrB
MKKIIIAAAILFTGSALYIFPMFNETSPSNRSSNERTNIQSEAEQLLNIESNDLAISSKKNTPNLPNNPNIYVDFKIETLRELHLSGGSFFELEAYMSRVVGVYDVTTGYGNGQTSQPSYEEVHNQESGHAEMIRLIFDPSVVNIETLLAYYLNALDSREFIEKEAPYRASIFYNNYEEAMLIQRILYHNKQNIAIEVAPLESFTLAEDTYQDYLEKYPETQTNIDLETVKENLIVYTKPSIKEIASSLSSLQYEVTQKNGTEEPYVNPYWDKYEDGIYVDIVTGQPLFSSLDKYDSDTGWPSFTRPISQGVVTESLSKPLIGYAKEVRSLNGDSHLGHIFGDGPEDRGGLRYCINSAALRFIPYGELEDEGYGYLEYLFE